MLAHGSARVLRQRVGSLMEIDERLGLVAHGSLGVAVVFPYGDHHEGKQHGIEHADHGEFESGDFIVEGEAFSAHSGPEQKHEADAVDLGDRDETKRHHPGRGLVQEQQQVHRDDRAQIAPM